MAATMAATALLPLPTAIENDACLTWALAVSPTGSFESFFTLSRKGAPAATPLLGRLR